ncbi:MAG: cyclic nucleotide-binding/CBS domain-containing protein [Dehalococcoidia bacterium]
MLGEQETVAAPAGNKKGRQGKRMEERMAEIRDLMVTHLIEVDPSTSARDAGQRMAENRVGAVLVVEGEGLKGIVSERDLVTRVLSAGKDPATTTAAEVATTDIVTVGADEPLRSVLETFRRSQFRHLPVLEDGRPVGILSTRDFLSFLVEGFETLIDDVRYHEKIAAGLDPYDHLGGSYGR